MTVLIAVGQLDSDQGLPLITMIVGYAVGNGIAARKGDPVDPIIGPKTDK